MNDKKFFPLGIILAAVASLLVRPQSIQAGPPLICWPYDIGGAKSLPWPGDPWSTTGRADYDLSRLVSDTFELLAPSTPVIVRMETLRRAALYAKGDAHVAKELLGRLLARAEDSDAKGHPDALAWFDAGYLVETYKQANEFYEKKADGTWNRLYKPNPALNLDGNAWVGKALHLAGSDPQMEFAAALTSCNEFSYWQCKDPKRKQIHEAHLQKAIAGATEGSLLAKNIVSRFGNKGGTLADLRARYEVAKN